MQPKMAPAKVSGITPYLLAASSGGHPTNVSEGPQIMQGAGSGGDRLRLTYFRRMI
jgi:hypothetical protein